MSGELEEDQERRSAAEALQKAISKGIESGEPQPFDAEAFKQRMREQHVKG